MKNYKKWMIFLSMVVLLGVTACGSTVSTNKNSVLRIGALYPLTGSLAVLGNENFHGAEIAVDLINKEGGVLGKKVELVTGDASTPTKALSEAERLVSKEGLQIITGTYSSGLSTTASEIADKKDVIYWETGATADKLTQRGIKNYFRFVYTASSNGELAANLVKDAIAPKVGSDPKKLKVLVIHEDSDYGTSVGDAAAKQASTIGFNVVGNIPYSASSTDLTSLVLKMKSLNPDVVIASSYANDALLIQRGMKQQGVNVKGFVGTGGIYGLDSFASGLGDDVNGIFDTQGSLGINPDGLTKDANELSAKFKSMYKEKYNQEPSYIAGQGFAGTWVLIHDVLTKAGGTEPSKVRDAALKIDIPMGGTVVGFGIKFAGPDNPMAGTNLNAIPVASQWQAGKEVVVYPSKFATAPVK